MSAIILDDKIVHYEVLGRGKPVVFLHGWVGSWRYWIPTMQAASTAYRAYALDLWGFGDTAKAPDRYNLERQIELIERFMDSLAMSKVALIGHGLGGIVALLFASRHPELVDRVMTIGLPMKMEDLNERLGTDRPADLVTWLITQTPAAETAQAEAPKADEQAIRVSLEDLKNLDMHELTRRLTTAALLVHGQNDPAIRPPSLNGESSFPRTLHAIIFDSSGHFPMLDEPSKFHRLMADFLDLESGQSPRQLQLKEEWKRRVR